MKTALADLLQRWWKNIIPTREALHEVKWLQPVIHRVMEPSLWRFHRRSVPRGVALGLLVGIFLMIPGLQIAGAVMLALPFRANVPLAAAMTFLSNPVTTPFIFLFSFDVGNRLLGLHADYHTFVALMDADANISAYLQWLVSDAAPAALVGLAVISILSAVAGFFLARLVWRVLVARKWRKRQLLRRASTD